MCSLTIDCVLWQWSAAEWWTLTQPRVTSRTATWCSLPPPSTLNPWPSLLIPERDRDRYNDCDIDRETEAQRQRQTESALKHKEGFSFQHGCHRSGLLSLSLLPALPALSILSIFAVWWFSLYTWQPSDAFARETPSGNSRNGIPRSYTRTHRNKYSISRMYICMQCGCCVHRHRLYVCVPMCTDMLINIRVHGAGMHIRKWHTQARIPFVCMHACMHTRILTHSHYHLYACMYACMQVQFWHAQARIQAGSPPKDRNSPAQQTRACR